MLVARIFPDTNILYPNSQLDLVMRLAALLVHELVLSEDLLDELANKWQEGRARHAVVPPKSAAEAALAGIRRTFPDEILGRDEYRHRIDTAPGSDPDDKPHIAAAVQGGATHIITNDRQGGFPSEQIHDQFGITVMSASDYFADLSTRYQVECRRVIEDMARQRARRHPETTTNSILQRMAGLGLAEMVANVQRRH